MNNKILALVLSLVASTQAFAYPTGMGGCYGSGAEIFCYFIASSKAKTLDFAWSASPEYVSNPRWTCERNVPFVRPDSLGGTQRMHIELAEFDVRLYGDESRGIFSKTHRSSGDAVSHGAYSLMRMSPHSVFLNECGQTLPDYQFD